VRLGRKLKKDRRPSPSPERWLQFHTIMRIVIFSFLLGVCLACSTHKNAKRFIPLEYELSEEDKQIGKILVYSEKTSGKYSYCEVFTLKKEALNYVVQSYRNPDAMDSILELNGKISEYYSHILGGKTAVKAQILKDTVWGTAESAKSEQHIRFVNDSMQLMIVSHSKYVKDTTFNWKGKSHSVIVTQTEFTGIINKFPENDDLIDVTSHFLTYYAKGIGVVRQKVFNVQEKNYRDINLVEIKDRSN